MEPGFIHVANTSEVATGKMKAVKAGYLQILLVNFDGALYAVDALCTHYAGDLSQGKLEGKIVTCPVHGSKFDVTTGKVVSGPVEPLGRPNIEDLGSYPVKVEKQEIYVKV